ncbi:MAG: acylneuraminate cytidylyltransferase family protein [Capnocytophaga sp.]|nr:acylneuraminate cytidylyltransferase family protein [Capnocytophaga sp.]
MNILVTICARGGSKGIPGKNIKIINNRPLISYTLEVAEWFAKIYETDIILSTDSAEIKNVVANLPFKKIDISYTRPEYLSSDTAGKLDTIIDVKNYAQQKNNKAYDIILDLDVTSPLRTVTDLENSLRLLLENQEAVNLFSVSPANRNPYFNMVEANEQGFYELCKKGSFLTRQSAPKVYDLNASFYFYKKKFFDENYKSVITNKSLVYEVPHICFDLDHPIDFEFMTYLLENKRLGFEFNY